MNLDRETASTERDSPPPYSAEPGRGHPSSGGPQPTGGSAILPYAVPMFAYIGLGGLEPYLPAVDGQPSPTWYPLGYAAKVMIVAILAWHYRTNWNDFRPRPKTPTFALAVLIGVVV